MKTQKTVKGFDVYHDLILQLALDHIEDAFRKNELDEEEKIIRSAILNASEIHKCLDTDLDIESARKLAREILVREIADFKAAIAEGDPDEYLYW